jgi:integrase
MARPSYLGRREGGRYFMQIRLGKPAASLYGGPILRASLRTANFAEARRRLVDGLGWAQHLVAAPDLETVGSMLHDRLTTYVGRSPAASERVLAERCAFEHQVRHYMSRANERGFSFSRMFPGFASIWVDFVDQNKMLEQTVQRIDRHRSYDEGRRDQAQIASAPTARPLPSSIETSPALQVAAIDPLQLIRSLVAENMQTHALSNQAAQAWQPQTAVAPGTMTAVPAAGPTMSAARDLYLAPPDRKKAHLSKGRAETAAIVQFAIDFLNDPPLHSVSKDDWDKLDLALPDIPHPRDLPAEAGSSLYARYCYAQKHGWDGISRVTETTIKGRYRYGLYKFIDWAIDEKLYPGPRPAFVCIDPQNLAALPRDAFEDKELLELLRLPLFTGCAGPHRIWTPGRYFVQNHLYWAYLILILTGMRPGEVGQIKCVDIQTDGEYYYFDLRPFDARKGRVAIEDLRNLKTNSSGRVVPIHPLLIELGLLDRLLYLINAGEERLFPEWKEFARGDGTTRWSQPITKSWQYVKKVLKIVRADLTLYATRHLMADWLDNSTVAKRTRDRILGHVTDVPGGYGRKGSINANQMAAISALEPEIVKQMREILMPAKDRAERAELVVLQPRSKKRAAAVTRLERCLA